MGSHSRWSLFVGCWAARSIHRQGQKWRASLGIGLGLVGASGA